jgi:hypothetical protein
MFEGRHAAERQPPDLHGLAKRLLDEGLSDGGMLPAQKAREAAINDAAILMLFAVPAKAFGSGSDFLEREHGKAAALFGAEFRERLESKMDAGNPFHSILLREDGEAIYRCHPQISHNYHGYCAARGRFEEYLKKASGRTSTRELLSYLLREGGVKFEAEEWGMRIKGHEAAGLPPRIIFFGDRGREDLPLAVERFLEENGVELPPRPHSTYLGMGEREEQGKRTTEWLQKHCRSAGRAHATFEEIELYTA